MDADQVRLERFAEPRHDDGVLWRGRQWLESGPANPNEKHLQSLYDEAKKRRKQK